MAAVAFDFALQSKEDQLIKLGTITFEERLDHPPCPDVVFIETICLVTNLPEQFFGAGCITELAEDARQEVSIVMRRTLHEK